MKMLDPDVRRMLLMIRDEILTGPERWNQGPAAVDAFGTSVNIDDSAACSWCLFGAVIKAGQCALGDRAERDLETVLNSLLSPSDTGYVHWNERPGRTYADVRALLDRALSEPKQEARSDVS